MTIITDGKFDSDDSRIIALEMELSDARDNVYRLKKALDAMSETNERLSAEISELRSRFGVSQNDVFIDYEVVYE